MSTNYTILLFYITLEAATEGILEKNALKFARQKLLQIHSKKFFFSVKLQAYNRF